MSVTPNKLYETEFHEKESLSLLKTIIGRRPYTEEKGKGIAQGRGSERKLCVSR
jgi:hypothetical protein